MCSPWGRFRQRGPAPARQRHCRIEECLGTGNHLRPALRIIAARPGRSGQRIGAVERVVQAAPARIGGVEHEARVERGHHQLRPGHAGDLGVDVARTDLERRRRIDQIADLAQERRAPRARRRGVDRRLQRVPLRQQRAILGREPCEYLRHARPPAGRLDVEPRQHTLLDEARERLGDEQAGTNDGHEKSSCGTVLRSPGEGISA